MKDKFSLSGDPATSHTGYNLEFNSSDIAVNATYVAYPVDHSERVTAAVITDATSEAHSTAHTSQFNVTSTKKFDYIGA